MLSVWQHARRVLHEEQSLLLCVEENFVYFAQTRFELDAWKKETKSLPGRMAGTSYERRLYKPCHWRTVSERAVRVALGHFSRSFPAPPLCDLAE